MASQPVDQMPLQASRFRWRAWVSAMALQILRLAKKSEDSDDIGSFHTENDKVVGLLRWLSLALQYTLMLSNDDEKQMAHVCFFNGRRSSTTGIRTWLLMVASPREVLLRKAGLAVGELRHGVWKAAQTPWVYGKQNHDTINCHSVLPNGHFRSVMVKNHA